MPSLVVFVVQVPPRPAFVLHCNADHPWPQADMDSEVPPGRRELLCRTELLAISDRHASASSLRGQSPSSRLRNWRASRTWSGVAGKLWDQVPAIAGTTVLAVVRGSTTAGLLGLVAGALSVPGEDSLT